MIYIYREIFFFLKRTFTDWSQNHSLDIFCKSFSSLLTNRRQAIMCLFLRCGTLPYRPCWWRASEIVVLLEISFLSIEQGRSSVRVTIGFLVTYTQLIFYHCSHWFGSQLKEESFQTSSIHRWCQLLYSLGLSVLQKFLYSSPDFFPRYSSVSAVYIINTVIPWTSWHGLCSGMHRQLYDLIKS